VPGGSCTTPLLLQAAACAHGFVDLPARHAVQQCRVDRNRCAGRHGQCEKGLADQRLGVLGREQVETHPHHHTDPRIESGSTRARLDQNPAAFAAVTKQVVGPLERKPLAVLGQRCCDGTAHRKGQPGRRRRGTGALEGERQGETAAWLGKPAASAPPTAGALRLCEHRPRAGGHAGKRRVEQPTIGGVDLGKQLEVWAVGAQELADQGGIG
jgi:hypothetical protein